MILKTSITKEHFNTINNSIKLYNDKFIEALSRVKDYAEARENSDAYRRGLPERPRT